LHPSEIDWVIMGVYFAFVLGVGLRAAALREDQHGLLSFRSLDPGMVAGLAFLSANLGAQEVIGMAASGAK